MNLVSIRNFMEMNTFLKKKNMNTLFLGIFIRTVLSEELKNFFLADLP